MSQPSIEINKGIDDEDNNTSTSSIKEIPAALSSHVELHDVDRRYPGGISSSPSLPLSPNCIRSSSPKGSARFSFMKQHDAEQDEDNDEEDDEEPQLWSPPLIIHLAYKASSTVVHSRGKTIKIKDCSITFPPRAVLSRKQFNFTLCYGPESMKNSDLLVLTPTLECSTSMRFPLRQPVTIQFPTCYVPSDPEVTVMCQSSNDGHKWTDVQEINHGGKKWISFETSTFSWKRVVAYVWKNLFSKRLSSVCYRNPNQSDDPFLIWDLRDDVIHEHVPLQPGEAFKETVTIGWMENVTLMISSPNTDIEPVDVEVANDVLYEQGIICQKQFRIKLPDPETRLESETFKYEIKSSLIGRVIREGNFAFPSTPPIAGSTSIYNISQSRVRIGEE